MGATQGKEAVGGKKAGPSVGRAGPDRGKKTDRAWVLLVWADGLGWAAGLNWGGLWFERGSWAEREGKEWGTWAALGRGFGLGWVSIFWFSFSFFSF